MHRALDAVQCRGNQRGPARPVSSSELTAVDRIAEWDEQDFFRRYMKPSRPVILTAAMDSWPALRSWSLDHLQSKFGARRVTVGKTRAGHLVAQRVGGILQSEMTLGAFIECLRGGDPGCYLLSPIDERVPELLADVRFDALAPSASWRSTRMWMGAKGTVSALHHDLPENFLAQVMGRKRITLIHRRHTRNVYRNSLLHGAPNFCAVDAEDPDFERFPRFRRVEPITIELAAGEVLYIPRLWWHHVRSLDVSISVNQWFARGALAIAARGSQLFARVRGLRR